MAEGRTYAATKERLLDAPRELVWALVSDTNRSDRALGLSAATYRWDVDGDGVRRRVAAASELGLALEWIEPPYQWIEGHQIQGRRTFVKGPVDRAGFEVALHDAEGDKTRAVATAFVVASGPIAFALGPVQRMKFARGLDRYFDAIEAVLREGAEALSHDANEPAAVQAKRILGLGYSEVTSGPRTPPDERLLALRGTRLRAAPVDEALAARFLEHLDRRPDEEVQQMRPFELARAWGVDKKKLLEVFLHGTVAGLVDLRWQINCPVCRVGAAVASDLGSLTESSHCEACEIRYDVDFAKHVEAVFPTNPAIRDVTPALYCASSPAFLPHVFAQLEIEPGVTREERFVLPPGAIHLRVLGHAASADLALAAPPGALRCTFDGETLTADATGASDGESDVAIENASDAPIQLLLERSDWNADAVLGTVIASFSEFVDLFATEAPAAGVELTVGNLALLFSDLVGSTALYERVGDARAFRMVEDHFREMAAAVAGSGGAIVKTMGDAVMAVFPSARQAAEAARTMIARHDALHDPDELGVKIGVHAGPCLAVRANDRLDYFGTTVNVAARLQAQAGASEIVLTEELAEELDDVLGDAPRTTFVANLKGIRDDQRLVRVDLGAR